MRSLSVIVDGVPVLNCIAVLPFDVSCITAANSAETPGVFESLCSNSITAYCSSAGILVLSSVILNLDVPTPDNAIVAIPDTLTSNPAVAVKIPVTIAPE